MDTETSELPKCIHCNATYTMRAGIPRPSCICSEECYCAACIGGLARVNVNIGGDPVFLQEIER